MPEREISDEYDGGYRDVGNRYRQTDSLWHATLDVQRFSSNTYPVFLPTGFVGGRSSLLTAVLAAGPLPLRAGRIFFDSGGIDAESYLIGKETDCRWASGLNLAQDVPDTMR